MGLVQEVAGLPKGWRGQAVEQLRFTKQVAVIGDIHGDAKRLRLLLAELGDMPVISVGDVCDRGPDTHSVMDMLIARGAHGVLGNHDLWFMSWIAGEGLDPAAQAMGGAETLRSYCGRQQPDPEQVPQTHKDWLLSLPVVVDLTAGDELYWVVHAGVPNTVPLVGLTLEKVVPWLAANRPLDLLWPFTDPGAMLPTGRTIIMGHQTLKAPLDTGSVIAVDTGGGSARGKLTAVILPERRFITVE